MATKRDVLETIEGGDRGETQVATSQMPAFNNALHSSGGMGYLPYAGHFAPQAAASQRAATNQPSGSDPSIKYPPAGTNSNQHYLPSSAPVSSLLPQIPQQNAHVATALQSQYAVLMGANGFVGNAGYPMPGHLSQHGESQSSANASSGKHMVNAMAPNMQNWPLAHLGTNVA
jgi:hypothetical protein